MSKFQKKVLVKIHGLKDGISFKNLFNLVKNEIDEEIPVYSLKRSITSMRKKKYIKIDTENIWENTNITITDSGKIYSGADQYSLDFSYNNHMKSYEKKEAEKKEFISANGFDPESGEIIQS